MGALFSKRQWKRHMATPGGRHGHFYRKTVIDESDRRLTYSRALQMAVACRNVDATGCTNLRGITVNGDARYDVDLCSSCWNKQTLIMEQEEQEHVYVPTPCGVCHHVV